jgi:hypothetical protein
MRFKIQDSRFKIQDSRFLNWKFLENYSRKFIFLFGGIFFLNFLSAQIYFERKDSVPVFVNSTQPPYAWAGGFNSPQFSQIDLNQDGILDLFVFDRAGNKITTFTNQGTPNQVSYVLDLSYVPSFPKMHDWVLLRDYNNDGKVDIFTSNASRVEVYKNISTIANGLQFQLVTTGMLTDITPNSTDTIVPLNVSWIDIPAIRDVDGDGDLDVLNYGTGGTQVEFHKNLSMDLYGNADSLKFTLEVLCWGEFFENISNANITLNVGCSSPPIADGNNQTYSPRLHSGSCLECLNIDGDNDQEVLIGDLSNPQINLVKNGGSSSYALCDSVDPNYPGYDTPMQLDIFGCAFHIDVDNDGKRDLIFAPNALNSSANYNNVEYYHNYGSDNAVLSHYIQKDFLVGGMIDIGEGAYPVFFDYDHDGDKDLFIGDKGYYNPSGIPTSMISLYENTGSNSAPIFTRKTVDFAGIFTQGLGINGVAPTFGDIDGDGDEDMITGDVNGKLYLFTKNPGSDTNFVLTPTSYTGTSGIDVGSFATPQLVDVDRDGDLDLLIGEQTGNVNYYQNTGTTTSASFTLVTALFGNVYVTQPGFTTGYSAPHLFDQNGNYVLLVGSERGWLNRYDNIDGNLAGTFTRTDSMYVSTYEGGRIAEAVGDLNNDSLFDVVIGNYAGGVSLFYGDNSLSITELAPEINFNLYPNPASSQVVIETGKVPDENQTLSIYNLAGQKIFTEKISAQKTFINTNSFADGVYVCVMTGESGFSVNRKLVIGR